MNYSLIKNINYMVLAQVTTYAMPLFLIPYLVRSLGLAEFGVFSVAQAIISVGFIVVQFGFNIYVTKEIAEKLRDGQSVNEIVSMALTLQVALATILICIMSLAYLKISSSVIEVGFWYSFAWLGQALFPIWYFQGCQQYKQLALLNILLRTCIFILVLLIVKSDEHLLILPVIYSISHIVIGALACTIMCRRQTLSVPSIKGLLALMHNTKDLFYSNIVSVLIMNMPVFFLNQQLPKTDVGAFSALLRIVYAIKGVLNSGMQVLIPTLISGNNKLNHKGIVISLLLISISLFIVSVSLMDSVKALLYGGDVTLNNKEYIVLFLSIIPGSLATLFIFVFVSFYGKFAQRKQAFFVVFVLAVILYFPLINMFASMGAAITILISETVLLVLGVLIIRDAKQSKEEFL